MYNQEARSEANRLYIAVDQALIAHNHGAVILSANHKAYLRTIEHQGIPAPGVARQTLRTVLSLYITNLDRCVPVS